MKHVLFLILSLLLSQISVKADPISVRELPLLNQLPERGILSSFRDSEGYLWYATANGLCRDDGYDITVFHADADNYINGISEDTGNRIWLSTRKGASYIDKKNYRVVELDSINLGDVPVKNVFTTSDGSIWVNTLGSLRRYDRNLSFVKSYDITDRFSNPAYVSGFVEDRNKQIYMTSFSRGVHVYDANSDRFTLAFPIGEDMPLGEMIADNTHNYLWINNLNGYIYRFDPTAKGEMMFVGSPVKRSGNDSSAHHVYSFTQDNVFNYIWACVRNHLIAMQPLSDGSLQPVALSSAERFDSKMIDDIYADRESLILSAYDSPSSVIYLSENNVTSLPLGEIERTTRFAPVINAVCTDSDPSFLWLLQSRSGLMLYNLAEDRMSYFNDFPRLRNRRLHMAQSMARSEASDGVWVSPAQSHTVFLVTRKKMNMTLSDSLSLDTLLDATHHVTALHEAADGNLWIGTTDALFRYSPSDGLIVTAMTGTSPVTSITSSGSEEILASTSGKGFIFATSGGEAKQIGIGTHSLTAIARGDSSDIWLGTAKGELLKFNRRDSSIVAANHNFGLNSALVRQLHVDHNGHVWIVADQHVIEYNPANGSFRSESGDDNAVTLSRFLSSTPALLPDGRLAVGGVGGINLFRSTAALDSGHGNAVVHISNVSVDGQSIVFDGNNIEQPSTITLSPDARNIEICLTTLDHRNISKTRYAYRILGLDEKWIEIAPGNNRIFINHLDKGEYRLELKASDENGQWGAITTVTIDRLPAVYETWWAYLIYLTLASAGIYLAISRYIEHINRRNDEIWTDSSEMLRMRDYLQSRVTLPDVEYLELDRILLDKATKEVEKNLSDIDFDVNRLSEAMGMSRSSFTRKLKAITGKTPIDFIRSIRMQHAYHMLENSDHTVAEAAEKVGYLDRRYFTASFKREFGITPSECQRRSSLKSDVSSNSSDKG